MQLRITDGTTTIDLAGATAGIKGVTYFPLPGAPTDASVSETVEVVGSGTEAQIRSAANSIERLLAKARVRTASGLGTRVFLEYRPVATDDLWRSEVYDGRIAWSDDPGLRRLKDANPQVKYGLLIERAPWWEGLETELAISSNGQAAGTGGKPLTNNGAANWIQAASVAGTLPAPVRLRLTQSTSASISFTRFYIGNNVYGNPTAFGHVLQGEDQVSGYGTDTALADASGGYYNAASITTTANYVNAWLLPTAMTAAAGRWFRLLLRTYPASSGQHVALRAQIFDLSGLNLLWSGQEVIWDGAQEMIDLGAAPIPPGGNLSTYGQVMLKIWAQKSTGSITLSTDYLALVPLDSYRYAWIAGGTSTQNDVFVFDDIEGAHYFIDGSTPYPVVMATGEPLMVHPGETNRFVIVCHSSSATGAAAYAFNARLYYRPRRSTV